MYMEDFTKMLKEEMSLLDDKDSEKGQELRRELRIEGLEGKELLKYKIDFLAKHMGHSDLHCMEKSDYFQELIRGCIDMKEAQEFFDLAKVTCIANDSSMTILCVLTDKEQEQEIGKGTIHVTTDKKDRAKSHIHNEELEIQQEGEVKTN